jgi:hypothetical protein
MRAAVPEITWFVETYHYETRTRTEVYYEDGVRKERTVTETIKVVTGNYRHRYQPLGVQGTEPGSPTLPAQGLGTA